MPSWIFFLLFNRLFSTVPLIHCLYFLELHFEQKKNDKWDSGANKRTLKSDGVKLVFHQGTVLVSFSILWWSRASLLGNETPGRTTELQRKESMSHREQMVVWESSAGKIFDLFMSLKGTLVGWVCTGGRWAQCVCFSAGNFVWEVGEQCEAARWASSSYE